MSKILVTGGAGYIGSHTLVDLIEEGYEVLSVDNFLNSTGEALSDIREITGVQVDNHRIDLCDLDSLESIFKKNNISAIIHFAALKSVGDSVNDPISYYHNNLNGLINLLKLQKKYETRNMIFSSSCTVYGNADKLPVTEDTPLKTPESPYGHTKKICEQIIFDFLNAHPDQKAVLLRYFNPAGAHESIKLGESPHNYANNLVPIITETAMGLRDKVTVFGSDYPTRDGTCVRDYIHIMDLAKAHTLALKYLLDGSSSDRSTIINLGSGTGSTVLEVINSFEKTSLQKLNYEIGERRKGDVMAIYADYSKAQKLLGWEPSRDLDAITSTAWKWEIERNKRKSVT